MEASSPTQTKKPNQPTFIDLIQQVIRKVRPIIVIILVVALLTVPVIPDPRWKITVLLFIGTSLVFLSFDIYRLITNKVADLNSALSGITTMITTQSAKVTTHVGDILESIRNVQDPLYKAAYSGNRVKPEVQVAIKMFKASTEAAKQLSNPKYIFLNQEEYINELMLRIDRMIASRKGTIRASCGEKDWENDGTKRWFNQNFEALKCNVSITRIFLEEPHWNATAANEQMREQANKGISVRFAKLKNLKNHSMLNNVPKGFGFVIFDYGNNKPEVVVHNDTMNINEKSVLFDDPMIVGQFLSVFNELSSDSYSEEVKSTNQNDVGIRLEREILQRSEEMTLHIKHLLDHRFSNLQLNFINWRFKTELAKIRKVLNGEVPIYALDKFAYLGDIFGHILDQLREGDRYQTISTVEIWNERNIGNQKFIRKTGLALKRKAEIDRIVFIDKGRFQNADDHEYHTMVKNTISLFDNFSEKNNSLNSILFFIDKVSGHFYDILKHAPVVLITEAGNKNRLGIHTYHVTSNETNREPHLNLKFYIEDDSDEHSEAFDGHFEPIKSLSINIDEMKREWYKRFPQIKIE